MVGCSCKRCATRRPCSWPISTSTSAAIGSALACWTPAARRCTGRWQRHTANSRPACSVGILQSMSRPTPTHATLDDWIAREATPFSVDSPRTFNAAVEKVIASLGDSVELLAVGEALHGGEDILILRNRLFQRLVEAHGY